MSKNFDGDYLYMLCNTSDYFPIPVHITTNLDEAIHLLEINKNCERGLKIWINNRIESKIVHFNGSYYQLMMDFVDDYTLPRILVAEIRTKLNSHVEEELNELKEKEENERKETERKELQELHRLAEKYGKTIID